jgi:hypothetical protein
MKRQFGVKFNVAVMFTAALAIGGGPAHAEGAGALGGDQETTLRSLDSQMAAILGDWDFPASNVVYRFQKQSESSVLKSMCDRAVYFQSPDRLCKKLNIRLHSYRADLDAFYAPKTSKYCSSSFQVSLQNPSNLVEVTDPLYTDGNCLDTGDTEEGSKIQ